MNFPIRKTKGRKPWCVDYRAVGEGRKFYETKEAAVLARSDRQKQLEKFGRNGSLSVSDQLMALRVRDLAAKIDATPEEALRFYAEHKGTIQKATVADVVKEFLAERVARARMGEVREVTVNYYRSVFNGEGGFATMLAERKVSSITRNDVAEWIAGHEWAPYTQAQMHNLIYNLLMWCVKRRVLFYNPLERMKRSGKLKAPEILALAECKSLFGRVAEVDKRLLPFAAMQLFGGLRISEAMRVVGSGYQQVKGGVIDLWGGDTKTRKRRHVQLDPTDLHGKTFSPLKEWMALDRTKWDEHDLRHMWYHRVLRSPLVPKAGNLFQWSHDVLRHTASSMLYVTMGPERAAMYCGHSLAVQEQHYRAEITQEQAQEFWNLSPQVLSIGR